VTRSAFSLRKPSERSCEIVEAWLIGKSGGLVRELSPLLGHVGFDVAGEHTTAEVSGLVRKRINKQLSVRACKLLQKTPGKARMGKCQAGHGFFNQSGEVPDAKFIGAWS
jgi:hypothetical protein